MNNELTFFTAVNYGDQPKTFGQFLHEKVDGYFSSGRSVVVVPGHNKDGAEGVRFVDNTESSIASTVLKVISICTVIIPLIFFVAKVIFRSIYHFYLISPSPVPQNAGLIQKSTLPKVNQLATNIFAGAYPGAKDQATTIKMQKALIEDLGITDFVCLMDSEQLKKFEPYRDKISTTPKPEWMQLEIEDGKVASDEKVLEFVNNRLIPLINDPARIAYLHCWGGNGRTSTISTILLAKKDKIDWEEALKRVFTSYLTRKEPKYDYLPETEVQFDQIKRLCGGPDKSYEEWKKQCAAIKLLIKTEGHAVKTTCIQTDESKQVRPYTGDLTFLEKQQMKFNLENAQTFKISFLEHPTFSVTVRRQDLFESGAQVIVNAANTHLDGGGGIDGAIHKQGGPVYAQAHKELKQLYNSDYVLGHAAMIDSGALKEKQIDNVIVVAGPRDEATPEKEDQLYSCYYNSLVLAHSQGNTSLAFPSISTGIFKFPKLRAAEISMKAISDFIHNYPATQLTTISIHFLPTDPSSCFLFYSIEYLFPRL